MRCRQCGLVCQNPQPQPDDLLSAYTSVIDGRYDEERDGRIHTFRQSLKELETHVQPGRLLDLGCHLGFFLEVAAEGGWEAQGLEPSSWAAETAREKAEAEQRRAEGEVTQSHEDLEKTNAALKQALGAAEAEKRSAEASAEAALRATDEANKSKATAERLYNEQQAHVKELEARMHEIYSGDLLHKKP